MKRAVVFAGFVACLLFLARVGSSTAGAAPPQEPARLDAAGLKAMLAGFGYEPKELSSEPGKEKWQIDTKTETLNIPVAAELSASQNYIWLTVFLGDAPKPDADQAAVKLDKLLRATAAVQPSMFYISSKGGLMLGIPVENRALTPADLRRSLDKLIADVGKTQDAWGSG